MLQGTKPETSKKYTAISVITMYQEQVKTLRYKTKCPLQCNETSPLGFTLYTSPVGNIIRKHGLKFHVYADDTQIYVSFNPRSPGACRAALLQLEHCITDLSDWMSTNMLKLNPTKTEFFIAVTSQGLQKLPSYVVLKGTSVFS